MVEKVLESRKEAAVGAKSPAKQPADVALLSGVLAISNRSSVGMYSKCVFLLSAPQYFISSLKKMARVDVLKRDRADVSGLFCR